MAFLSVGYGQMRLAAGVTGREGEQEHGVRPQGQELTHQERTKRRGRAEKGNVIWEEGTWSRDTWRWKRNRDGRMGEGRKVTHSDGE